MCKAKYKLKNKDMKLFAILTLGYMEEALLETNKDGFTMVFNTKEDAQKVIDENQYEDSSVIELNLDM